MRIERVLDAAKAQGLRNGDNPARWRGHLDQLLAAPRLARRLTHEVGATARARKLGAETALGEIYNNCCNLRICFVRAHIKPTAS